MTTANTPTIDLKKTYLAMIENAVGTNLFRNLHGAIGGAEQDLLRDGELSCAVFVSSILHLVQKIDGPHSTVASTVHHMKAFGWVPVPLGDAQAGDVLVWNAIVYPDGEAHAHVGFFMSRSEAISNSAKQRVPVRHHLTYNESRTVTEVLHWPKAWTAPPAPGSAPSGE